MNTDDTCDGLDNNCNDQIDEDWSGDSYEPNDEEAHWLGDLEVRKQLFNPLFFQKQMLIDLSFMQRMAWPGFVCWCVCNGSVFFDGCRD